MQCEIELPISLSYGSFGFKKKEKNFVPFFLFCARIGSLCFLSLLLASRYCLEAVVAKGFKALIDWKLLKKLETEIPFLFCFSGFFYFHP